MRVLCLSGGGFKGAVQLPVLARLLRTEGRRYDLIQGVSVGAINGAMASQGDLDALDRVWDGIDDGFAYDGVRGYLSVAILGLRAVYSLRPLRRKLRTYLHCDRLQVPLGVGVVVRNTGEYHTLRYDAQHQVDRGVGFQEAVLGSSAIAPLMEPQEVALDGRPCLLSDGGHVHILPPPPREATEVDAVFTLPVHRPWLAASSEDDIFAASAWAVENQFTLGCARDFEDLKRRAVDGGLKVRVYAPPEALGGLLKADAATIRERKRVGEAMAGSPVYTSG